MSDVSKKSPLRSHTLPGAAEEGAPLVIRDPALPAPQGLYDPANEKDSCGVGFIADMKNRKSHKIVEQGLAILRNLAHRGAVGADPKMGDGCGILVQIPHAFFAAECDRLGIALPGARRIRRGASLHAAGSGRLPDRRGDRREGHRRRGAPAPRLARRPGRQLGPRREREGGGAAAPPGLHRQGQGHGGPGGLRAPALPRPEGHLERGLQSEGSAHGRLLPGLPVLAHHRLQGHGARHASSAAITRTCATRASRALSLSSTSASPRTPSRAGSSRTPTAWSPTTARSTRCAAT